MTKTKEPVGITLVAQFWNAKTTIDKGWLISFQVSQDEAQKIVQLSALSECNLQLAVVPFED